MNRSKLRDVIVKSLYQVYIYKEKKWVYLKENTAISLKNFLEENLVYQEEYFKQKNKAAEILYDFIIAVQFYRHSCISDFHVVYAGAKTAAARILNRT